MVRYMHACLIVNVHLTVVDVWYNTYIFVLFYVWTAGVDRPSSLVLMCMVYYAVGAYNVV